MNAPHADLRERYLRDRVLTATPAQRVVMLYDRLLLDLTFAAESPDDLGAAPHLSHAMLIVAELQASLDPSAGGPAENLARIYGYLIQQLIGARSGGRDGLPGLVGIVSALRESWAAAIEQLSGAVAQKDGSESSAPHRVTAPAGAWIG
jgi:flagellar secretion chaperone FliS